MQHEPKYTAEDFERYHSGKMSEGEMHTVEKAALEDPFLADALEGYSYAVTPEKDVAELREKLFTKKKEKRNFFVITKQNALLRIAALFVLIAGVGYLAFFLHTDKTNNMFATKQERSEKNDTAKFVLPQVSLNDSGMVFTSPDDKRFNETGKEFTLSKSNRAVEKGLPRNVQQGVIVPSVPDNESRGENSFFKQQKADTSFITADNLLMKNKEEKVTFSRDSLAVSSPVSAIRDMAAATSGRDKSNTGIPTEKGERKANVVPQNRELEEVTVTGYDKKRSMKSSGYSTITTNDSSLRPDGSLPATKDYIQKNISVPVDGNGNKYHGSVILSFKINKEGRPVKIRVEQSLCKACDDEAKRLLNNSPVVKYVTNKRQRLEITF